MNLGQLRGKCRTLLDDGGGTYSNAQIDAAINAAMRVFAFLTLCVERQALIPLNPGAHFYRLLTAMPDFLVPLRVELRSGSGLFDGSLFDQVLFDQAAQDTVAGSSTVRLRPAQVSDFRAEDDGWLTASEAPRRYAMMGFDLLAVDRGPLAPSALLIKYAALPAAITLDIDAPEIPEPQHEDLTKFVPFWLRVREGGSLHAETREGLDQFVEGARQVATFVRARALAQRYDRKPSEFTLADESQEAKTRPDLSEEAA